MKLTTEYIDKKFAELDQKFATKDDIKALATKDDLHNFATKEDLKNFTTKDDLKDFVIKDDLAALEFRMGKKFATKDDLLELATKSDFKKLEDKVDDIQLKVTRIDMRTDGDIRAAYKDISQHKRKLDDYEARITNLEKDVQEIKA